MATNLTAQPIKDSFDQLLHVDDGPEAAEKTVYSGTGVATALKVGTGSASVDNVQLDGNTIRTLDTNGNLTLAPNGTGSVAIGKAAITGGTISGITDLAVADGGTGASDASGARTNLGLGTIATQNASAVAIAGGTIEGTPVGGTTRAAGTFTNALATTSIGYTTTGGGAVTQATDKTTGVTLNAPSGQITMNAASLAAATAVSFVMTNGSIAATDVLVVNIKSGATTNSYTAQVELVSAGSCRIQLRNHTLGALAEAVILSFAVIKGVIA